MSMNVNDKNIGHATAYAYYKAGGGTMTEAEFTEFMADFGTASQTAVEAAQAALASKNAAQTAATTANNKASEATTAAQTAITKAAEASTSASTATSAKDTAVSASQTATTKATEATTAAATATGAATTATTAKEDAVSAKTAAQTAQTGAETAAASAQEIVDGIQAESDQIEQNKSDIAELQEDKVSKADFYNAFPTDTANGAVASFSDGAELPVKSLIVDIDPVQDLHGQESPYPAGGGKNLLPNLTQSDFANGEVYGLCTYIYLPFKAGTYTISTNAPNGYLWVDEQLYRVFDGTPRTVTLASDGSIKFGILTSDMQTALSYNTQIEKGSTATAYAPYSNICPISGHTQAVVTRTGKNLFDGEWLVGYWDAVNGEFVASNIWRSSKKIACRPSTKYIVSGLSSSQGGYTGISLFWDANGSYIGYRNTAQPFTTYDNAAYMAFYTNVDSMTNVCQLEEGSVVTAYEAPQIQSVTIPLGQTVYGGTLDVLSGELVIDRAMVDATTLAWAKPTSNTNPNGTYFVVSGVTVPFYGWTSGGRDYAISNALTKASINGMENNEAVNSFWWNNARTGYRCIWGTPNGGSTIEEFLTFIQQNSVVFVGKLATPITVTLTPNELSTLLGANNIWSDAGEVTAEYRADPTLFIQRKIAEALS